MLVGISVNSNKVGVKAPEVTPQYLAGLMLKIASDRCQRAYAELFRHFAPRLRSYAMGQVKNEAIAMEVVQDTMANVWHKAHLFNSEKGSPSTWIFTIARNIHFDYLRKQKNRKEDICSDDLWPVLMDQVGDDRVGLLEDQTCVEQIHALLTKLPTKQQTVVKAIYIEGKSQQEVADAMGIPLGTVKSRARLALQRLREMIEQHD
jgi:RNA polymerase sigma-70 factor (ECF subfamily)